jgi:hypothetical protein
MEAHSSTKGFSKVMKQKRLDLPMIVISSWSLCEAAPSFQMSNGDLTILKSLNHPQGVTIRATDGEIRKADQFYFDDAT